MNLEALTEGIWIRCSCSLYEGSKVSLFTSNVCYLIYIIICIL